MSLPEQEAGIAIALLLGERGGVPAWLEEAYRRFGLLHLLAVSGMHLWIWDLLLRRLLLGRSRHLRWPLLLATVLLAGARPPVLRAGVVLLLREGSQRWGFRLPALQLWTTAWAVECLGFAPAADDLGLLLSYSATLFLIVGSGLRHFPAWRRTLQASTVAFLASMPLLHAVQGTVEPWSIPFSPLLALLLPLRLLATALALLPGGPLLAAPLLQACSDGEQFLLHLLAGLPAAPWVCPQQSSLLLGLAAIAGLLALQPGFLPSGRTRLLAAILLPLLVAIRLPSTPTLLLLDTGHGLAVVTVGREGSLLFDCGSAEWSPRQLIDRELLPLLGRHHAPAPERALASHQDKDHVNGFPFLAQRVPFRRLTINAGSGRHIPGLGPWHVDMLGVEGALRGVSNDGGAVLSLYCRGARVVVLGDQQGASLRDLCSRLAPGPIALLVLPHHGLSTDGLAELLQHLQPQLAWVSCGQEDLPLPAAPLLEAFGIPLQTTLQGSLVWQPPRSGGEAWGQRAERKFPVSTAPLARLPEDG